MDNEVEILEPGELRTVQTPCSRCKKLGIRYIVRNTILAGPGTSSTTAANTRPVSTGDLASRNGIELPWPVPHAQPAIGQDKAQVANVSVVPRTKSGYLNNLPPSQGDTIRWNGNVLLIRTPQSPETVLIIRTIDTLRYEKVEEE